MSFLAPFFLAGLAALAVPVLIHLIQRERKNVVAFPSLMFLRRIPYESVRRRRIRNRLLLLMRLAALALIIAAFARPFVRGASLVASAGGPRDVVILLDRSYSMGYADQWGRARQAAADVANTLGAADRASLVMFATGAEVAVRSTNDRALIVSQIEAAEPSAGATRFGPGLKLAGSLLAESTAPRREVVMISDFQQSGWSASEGLRLPEGTTLTTVAVGASETGNLSVTPVSLQREIFSGQERVAVTAGVINRGGQAVSDLEISLFLDGRVVQTAKLSVDGHGSASTTFAPVTVTAENTRATVQIGDDALERDNVFHFVLSPPKPVDVTLVTGARRSGDPALYLRRALAIGENPRFAVTVRALEELTDELLVRTRVVILRDVAPGDSAGRLKRFVERGGGLWVISGAQASWPASADLLPATLAGTVDRSRGPAGTLSGLQYGHAVFEPFRAPRSGDFSAARFYSYRHVTAAKDALVLARFDDGTPALLERPIGRGRVLLWTSTLDLGWNDLPLKPVFLPFIHQVVRHLAAYRERAAWSTVGQVLDLTDAASDGAWMEGGGGTSGGRAGPARTPVVLAPSGRRISLEGDQAAVLELTEQGFYEVREARQGGSLRVAASNVDLGESDRTVVDPREVVAAVTSRSRPPGHADGAPPISDEAQERSQRIWWYLLFAGILLLTAESLLAHRLSRPAS